MTADLGGTTGWGALAPPAPDEPVFVEPWEGRAFALTLLTMGRVAGRNLDAFRHALARLDPARYLGDGYYGRWVHAAELMLVDSAILAPGAVDARTRLLVRADTDVDDGVDLAEPAVPEPARPDYAPSAPGSLREVADPPLFAVGESVFALERPDVAFTRLPRYVWGRVGEVQAVRPGHLLPDTHALFLGENPQHVYTVRFEARELWGGDAEDFAVTVEVYESYLETA